MSGDCAANGSVTLAAGDNKVCTITNTRHATLTVNKVLNPAGDTGRFNLQIDTVTKSAAGGVGNGGTTGAITVTTGVAHTVGETAAVGSLGDYDTVIGGDCAANGSVTLAAGDNKVCTITNTRHATLTVNKVLSPAGDTGRFNLQCDTVTKSAAGGVGNGGTTGAITVTTGVAHTVGETAAVGSLGDYDTVIGGDCAANGSITLAAGDSKVCTITNTRHATLTVNKVLSPAGDTGRFNLQCDTVTKSAAGGVGNGGTTGAITVTTGVAHTVGETAAVGSLGDYDTVIGGDCAANGSITLAAGDSKVCTITNTRHATLTVNKVLSPAGDTGRFNLQCDTVTKSAAGGVGNGGTTGAIVVTSGVAHTVGETAAVGSLGDYDTVIGGDCAANGSVTLAAGDNKVCTITNTRHATLTVNKVLSPAGDTGRFNLQCDTVTKSAAGGVGNGGTTGAIVVTSGVAHTVGETAAVGSLGDYDTVIGGDCAADGSVTLAPGDQKACTITNTRHATLTVNKVLNPAGDTGKFNLQIDTVTKSAAGGVGNGGTTGAIVVTTGAAHTVSETAAVGSLGDYDTVIGGDCAANGSVTLAAGDNKVCTITNSRHATLTVNKVLSPAGDTGKFNLQIDTVTKSAAGGVGNGGTTGAIVVTSGVAHTVGETAAVGSLGDYDTVIGGDCAA